MSDVGKPEDYQLSPDYSNPGGSPHVIRPLGGFMEERVAKLEYDSELQETRLSEVEQVLSSSYTMDKHSASWFECKACKGPIKHTNPSGSVVIPICDNCFETIGMLTKVREDWMFKKSKYEFTYRF